jgi:uncharacterized membrane protein YhiD involved in acid resistance
MQALFDSLGPTQALTAYQILLSLCVAFLAGSFLASVYRWTHTGFSYSRSYVQTLVLAAIVACIMIIAIGNNLARGLGILGALALIRFRTPIRDPRDIIFLFAALAIGIASGAQVFGLCILGTLFYGLTSLYLSWSPFTSRREFEGLLRFMAPSGSRVEESLRKVFEEYTSSVEMVSVREALQGDAKEYAYQVRLRDPTYKGDLMSSLEALPDVSEVSIVMQRSTVEI